MCSALRTDPENITDDAFLGGRLSLLQPRHGHRSGSDAVFLAAAVPAQSGQCVLEAGAGAGVASLCLAARVQGLALTLVEHDAALCDLARENATRSGHQAAVVAGDVTASGAADRMGVARESFDCVFANPPYYAAGRSRPKSGAGSAHVMPEGGLDAWLRFLASVCRPGGTLTLIHRADALPALLGALERRFGGVTFFPLFPREGVPAERLLIRGTKGSRKELKLLPGLVLHGADGRYTDAAEAVLRHGAALDLD